MLKYLPVFIGITLSGVATAALGLNTWEHLLVTTPAFIAGMLYPKD